MAAPPRCPTTSPWLPLFGLLAAACSSAPAGARRPAAAPTAEPTPTPLSSRFTADQTFAFVLPRLQEVQGVGGVKASDCEVCHQQIHAEWAASTHASALSDLQYQAEIFKPSSPRWLCLNCHIPVQNQRRFLVRGLRGGDVMRPVLEPNPGFDAEMMAEAITCAVCHVRPDASGASEIVGPRGNPRAPHPVRADRRGLRSICLRCHDPRGERITPLLVCWFKTREELERGPLGQSKDCVDCHMPVTRRRLARDFSEFPERQVHRHHWVGGGVPKSYAGYAGLLGRGFQPGLDVRLIRWTRSPEGSGGKVTIQVQLKNARAGHRLPTADPERHLRIIAALSDRQGRRLAQTSLRIGQTWRWSPRAEKLADNRLGMGQSRSWSATLAEPPAAHSLELLAYHVRLTSDNARHMREARVEDTYVKGAGELVKQIERHYPMATLVYSERVLLSSGERRVASPEELVRRSRAEQHRPLKERDY